MNRVICTAVCLLASIGAGGSSLAQEPAGPRTDASGDPLPAGALARLGSLRWSHPQPVVFVAFLPDGKAVLTGAADHVFRLWDRTSGKEIRRYVVPAPAANDSFRRYTVAAALSPDGKTLAVAASKHIRLWDVQTGKKTREFEAPKLRNRPLFGEFKALLFAPDGKSLAVNTIDEAIHIVAVDSGTVVRRLHAQAEEVFRPPAFENGGPTMAFSPDGKRILSKEFDGRPGESKKFLRMTEVATGKELWRSDYSPGITAVAYAPNGKLVAAFAMLKGIQLLDAESGRLVRTAGKLFACSNIQFTGDGKHLLANYFGGDQFAVCAVDSGTEVRRFGKRRVSRPTGLVERPACDAPAVSPDGNTVITGVGNTVRMWQTDTGNEMALAGGARGDHGCLRRPGW